MTGGGGGAPACVPGSNPACNDDPAMSSIAGQCINGGCVCDVGFVLNPVTGRCRVPVPCDPVAQDCPLASDACYPRLGATPVCLPAGRRLEGAPCTTSNECALGYFCPLRPTFCHRICAATASCDQGQTCSTLAGFTTRACEPPGSYQACMASTALERVAIARYQPASQRCTLVRLVSPGRPTMGVNLPQGWAVERASTTLGVPSCVGTAFTGAEALSVGGTVTFQASGARQVDSVSLRLTFGRDAGTQTIDLGAEALPLGVCP